MLQPRRVPYATIGLVTITLVLNGCVTSVEPVALPRIDRRPDAADFGRGIMGSTPAYDPASPNPFQVDLRSYDLSRLDLTDAADTLLYASFDDRTQWPAAGALPDGFDPERIMALGMDPGLGLRGLHANGVTGRGVGIAIVDQPLLTTHEEYADRLRLYEEIDVDPSTPAQMHGPAVASLAVGRSVGVAPEADLYYIGAWTFDRDHPDPEDRANFEYVAQGVDRILEINKQLPAERRIRVISISVGWSPGQRGYDQITRAVARAKRAGMLVICSSVEQIHGFRFHGLGRAPLDPPLDPQSYRPGSWWAQRYYDGLQFTDRLLVPMDSRTAASPTGDDEYVFYRHGGWSWAIPYIAGLYALAAQVAPEIDPDTFWAAAMRTGRTITFAHDAKRYTLGPIVDPPALIAELQA